MNKIETLQFDVNIFDVMVNGRILSTKRIYRTETGGGDWVYYVQKRLAGKHWRTISKHSSLNDAKRSLRKGE